MQQDFAITLDWQRGYEFDIDFELDGVPHLTTDEPAPLGAGNGPNPSRLLAAAVGNCLSASLRYCLERSRVDVQGMRTRVEGTMVRNERGRLRIGELRVKLEPVVAGDTERLGRCLGIFEDFCIVGRSVHEGIDIAVEVAPAGLPAALPA